MNPIFSRREWLAATPAVVLASTAQAEKPAAEPFGYCLNTSTIRGQNLDLVQEVEIAAKAGFQAIEPWIREMEQYIKGGGSLKELGKRIGDRGLTVESAIGFTEWIVDDDAKRKKGMEETRRCMDMVRQIGGKRLAAPPVGATNLTDFDLRKAAERYRAVLELGDQIGVVPELEFWGPSKTLNRLSEAMFVAVEAGHPKACILADVYHLYKGGSRIAGLDLVNGNAFHVLHFNDYPAKPTRDEITDAFRVYPGDGVAPLKELLRELQRIGFRGFLSLELFNRDYWKQDALTVARTGLEKMKTVVRNSVG